jgi:hypothetical protein
MAIRTAKGIASARANGTRLCHGRKKAPNTILPISSGAGDWLESIEAPQQ